jgi:hypothetical protein
MSVQWPSGLRPGSAAARWLELWIRIPPQAWISVCWECCQVEVSATSWSLAQRGPTECGVSSKCYLEAPEGETICNPKLFEALERENKNLLIESGRLQIRQLIVGFQCAQRWALKLQSSGTTRWKSVGRRLQCVRIWPTYAIYRSYVSEILYKVPPSFTFCCS